MVIRFNHHEGSKEDYLGGYPRVHKKKPAYFCELRYLSETSLIFIAVDKASLLMIRRFNQPCLFCQEDAAVYDLDFCSQREVWVLYADKIHFIAATQLAYTVQRSGAAKVCAVLVDNGWIKERFDV